MLLPIHFFRACVCAHMHACVYFVDSRRYTKGDILFVQDLIKILETGFRWQ